MPGALALVRDFADAGKPIVAVCRGPQLLAAADVIAGRKITGWPEIQDELEEAGAIYMNDKAVVDGPFLTSRWPRICPCSWRMP